MIDSYHQVAALVPLLDMAFQAEQRKLAKIARRIAALHDQLNDLDRATSVPTDDISPAQRVGADLRWERWAEARKNLINREMALAAAQRSEIAGKVAQALAKREAAVKIADRIRKQEKYCRARRAEW